jgi:hypothetical protein
MNLILVGKICAVLIAVLQVVILYCNGTFTWTAIGTIIAALIAAGFIHTGQAQVERLALKRGVSLRK